MANRYVVEGTDRVIAGSGNYVYAGSTTARNTKLNYVILTCDGAVASGDTDITFNEIVPISGYPFRLVVSSPFEIWEATAYVGTNELTVSRRMEDTTNTSTIVDTTRVVCELTHETLGTVYNNLLVSEKTISESESTALRVARVPAVNEVTIDTDLSKVYVGVDGAPDTWEEFAPESHADLDDLATSTGHTQYYTDGRTETWHTALSGVHLGQLAGVEYVSINTGGSGYSVGDILTITPDGDDNCTLTVLTLSGSAVATIAITTVGSGYSTSSGSATTVAPSGGTGCTIDIDSIIAKDHNHISVPATNIRDLASEPADTVTGGMYYNTVSDTMYYYDGADWKQYNTVPPNAIIFRDDGACPDGWTEKTAWDGYFLKGDSTGVWAGGSGGSETHVHTVSEIPAHAHTIPNRNLTLPAIADHYHSIGGKDSVGSGGPAKQNNNTTSLGFSSAGEHTHPMNVGAHNTNDAGTASAESQSTTSRPKYVELTICEKN